MRSAMKIKRTILLTGVLIIAMGVLNGCKNDSSGSVTKEEEKQFRAPLGQPMPPQARAAMEKMNRQPAAPAVPATP